MNIWDFDKLFIFIAFVIPGFVSLKAYEIFVPGPVKDSSKQVVDAVAYSCLNYAILLYPIIKFFEWEWAKNYPLAQYLFYFFVFFGFPVVAVVFWRKLRSTQMFQNNMPHPTQKPWDFVFAQRKPYWVKVVLKDRSVVGGLYKKESFASSSPAPEQIYLQETWVLNDNGGFVRKKNDTNGIIILTDEISHIELREFRVK